MYLESSDHHCAWVNTAALRLAGITAQTPDPPAGHHRRGDRTVSRSGTLVEWTAMDLVRRLRPASRPRDEKLPAVTASTALLAAAGVTWAQDAALAPQDVAVYLEAAAAGRLSTRVNVALRAEPDRWRDAGAGVRGGQDRRGRPTRTSAPAR